MEKYFVKSVGTLPRIHAPRRVGVGHGIGIMGMKSGTKSLKTIFLGILFIDSK